MMNIRTWMIDFTKPGLVHTEYIIGTKGQVLEYSERQVVAYGGTASVPVIEKIPEYLSRNEKVVNLTRPIFGE